MVRPTKIQLQIRLIQENGTGQNIIHGKEVGEVMMADQLGGVDNGREAKEGHVYQKVFMNGAPRRYRQVIN